VLKTPATCTATPACWHSSMHGKPACSQHAGQPTRRSRLPHRLRWPQKLWAPWSLTTFQSRFRVSGWFRSHPYKLSGGFRVFQDVAGSAVNDHVRH
jgi:hypothetical protein